MICQRKDTQGLEDVSSLILRNADFSQFTNKNRTSTYQTSQLRCSVWLSSVNTTHLKQLVLGLSGGHYKISQTNTMAVTKSYLWDFMDTF